MKFLDKYNHTKNVRFNSFKFALLEAEKRKLKTIVETGCARGKTKLFFFSKINWKDSLEIVMKDGTLDYNDEGIILTGRLTIDTDDIDKFYSSFQIKKINRKLIKKVEVDFIYNFNKNKFFFSVHCIS